MITRQAEVLDSQKEADNDNSESALDTELLPSQLEKCQKALNRLLELWTNENADSVKAESSQNIFSQLLEIWNIAEVPSEAIWIRSVYNELKHIWPMTFKQKDITEVEHTQEQKQHIADLVKLLIDKAGKYLLQRNRKASNLKS